MKNTIFLLALICLVSCYHTEKTNNFITIRKTNSKKFELELISKNFGRGNLHRFDLSEFKFDM